MKRIEKLTAEHLAIYLAYGLEIVCNTEEEQLTEEIYISKVTTLHLNGVDDEYANNWEYTVKPILRTRKSITPEELETFSICFRMWYDKPSFDYNLMVYSDVVQMAKLHIDIFGLIESGLAVDKQTIKNI